MFIGHVAISRSRSRHRDGIAALPVGAVVDRAVAGFTRLAVCGANQRRGRHRVVVDAAVEPIIRFASYRCH